MELDNFRQSKEFVENLPLLSTVHVDENEDGDVRFIFGYSSSFLCAIFFAKVLHVTGNQFIYTYSVGSFRFFLPLVGRNVEVKISHCSVGKGAWQAAILN